LPLSRLKDMVVKQTSPLDFASALTGNGVRLIAEVKKASPSRGVICPDFDPVAIARSYADNGASAISVLTESKYFEGNIDYLGDIRNTLADKKIPLLRKDFLTDPYQIYEARAYGADSLLLIVAILIPEKLDELIKLSHDLGMSCLVEVHNEAELEIALTSRAGIIGINNRDLHTFTVDLATTERLRPLIPADKIVVSESGIKDSRDIEKTRKWGVNAVLVGETLMAASDIAARMQDLMNLETSESFQINRPEG